MENFRKYGPTIQVIQEVKLPKFDEHILDNGMPLYSISQGTQDIIKIDLVFRSGRAYEIKKAVSRVTNNQIKEGNLYMNSKKISDTIDYYGATLRTSENLDHCTLSLFTLGKHFAKLIPILFEVINNPVFPVDELRKYIHINTERLKVELEKNDVIAYRTITESIFGKDHPYGYNSEIIDYKSITRDDLILHFEKNYGYNNGYIFLSGKVTDQQIILCNKYFGQKFRKAQPVEQPFTILPNKPVKVHKTSKKEFQTAIKIGRKLFKRNHEDYPGIYFLNAILGGYFGSRLMSNIREDKGFTYNIYSEADVMEKDGLFMIGTEVGDQYVNETMKEINKEIRILKTELVPEEELNMVRNYLLGRMLNFIDGPFNTARLVKSIVLSNLGKDYFDHLVSELKEINAEGIRTLANKYLATEEMWVVTVGKKSLNVIDY